MAISVCPYCQVKSDAHASVSEEPIAPSAGDASLCIVCCGVAVFDEDGGLRMPTQDEALRFASDPLLMKVRIAWSKTFDGEDKNGLAQLPCGCITGTLGSAFVMQPCSLTCINYFEVVEIARQRKKPIVPVLLEDS